MAEQRFGGDVRIYGSAYVMQQATGDDAIVARKLLIDTSTDDRDRSKHTGTQLFATISDGPSYVDGRIQEIVGAAPAALDTLEEIAAALQAGDTAAEALTAQVAQLRTDHDLLEDRVEVNEADIVALRTDVDTNTDDIAALRTDLTTTQGAVTTNTTNLSALTNRVGTAETDIDQLQSDLAALTGDSGTNITELRDDLDAVTERVRILERDVSIYTQAIVDTVHLETVGDGTASVFTINHAFGTEDVEVTVREEGQKVFPVDAVVDADNISLDFGSYVPPTGSIRVIVRNAVMPERLTFTDGGNQAGAGGDGPALPA